MTWVDGVVLIVLGVSALLAFMRGFVREALGLAAWVAAAWVAIAYFGRAQEISRRLIADPDLADPVAFGVVFLAVLIVASIVAKIVAGAVRGSLLGGIDRTLGMVFGLVRGAVLVAIAYVVAGMLVPIDQWPEPVLRARALPYAYRGARIAVAQLPADDRPKLYPPPDAPPITAGALMQAAPQGYAFSGRAASTQAGGATHDGATQ